MFAYAGPLAVDRDFPDHPMRDLLAAVEVEFLAGDLSVREFEAEVDFYLRAGLYAVGPPSMGPELAKVELIRPIRGAS